MLNVDGDASGKRHLGRLISPAGLHWENAGFSMEKLTFIAPLTALKYGIASVLFATASYGFKPAFNSISPEISG